MPESARESFAECEAYALSLAAEVERLRAEAEQAPPAPVATQRRAFAGLRRRGR